MGRKIFIVEDEPVVAMCLEDILLDFGCSIIGPVGRLSEGLVIAEAVEADAAILDVNLGGERSDAIASVLRARGIPYILATGYGATANTGEHIVPLVSKPYCEEQLRSALESVIAL
ncbi:response regulator [Stakelama tenebrarum]|uniref:Response regulator n=1 Tax=Stakelama tenebrarum TaxID=2711215 RepID=A0A6G6Y3K1_9SPHN|nr:response regulator [Sphingosinithalassobacter tenebrarum]QIG79495.1 response regulator [Sphingosinithalassobacter tenebrarum]